MDEPQATSAASNSDNIDLSAGLVPKAPPTSGADDLDLSAGLVPKSTETGQPSIPKPTVNMETSTAGAIGEPVARGAESAYRALGGGALGDTNAEVKQRLKEIAQHPVDNTLAFGKGILDAQGELAHKAKDAWKNGDYVGAAAHALYYLLPGIGPSLAKAGEQMSSGDIAGGIGTTLGTAAPMLMDVVKPEVTVPKTGFKAASEASAREAAVKPATKVTSAAETAPKALPAKEAGQAVQAEAKATRDVAGKKVGAAKEAVQKSIDDGSKRNIPGESDETVSDKNVARVYEQNYKGPDIDAALLRKVKDNPNVSSDVRSAAQAVYEANKDSGMSMRDAMNLNGNDSLAKALGGKFEKTLNSNATKTVAGVSDSQVKGLQKLAGKSKPVLEPKALTKSTVTVLKDTADAEQLAGAKDPDMADVRSMAEHLSKGTNAAGDPLSLDSDQVDSMKRAFNQKIDALQAKADAGGNATALRHLKSMKQAWQEDLYDAYEQHGDPEAAKALRAASKEYAKVVDEQTSGPARTMFRNQSPEKIVSTIVSSGARSQSAVESLARNMSDTGKQTLRDSVLKEIYRKNTLPDGTIDMVKARKNFYSLGDTAKTLYGDNLKQTMDYLDAASKEQMKRNAKAGKPSVASGIKSKLGKTAGAGTGAFVGSAAGPPGAAAGAVVGSEVADALFQNGKSGAVKIGISPTERIVLTPAQASSARPMLTRFLKAKSAGNVPAMTAAYNAIAGVRKPDKTNP